MIMEENVYEISLGEMFRVAIKHWWIILIAAVLGAALAFTYVSFFVAPTYSTNAKVGITTANMSDYQQTLVGNSIAKEGSEILTGNITLGKAAEMLNASEEAKKFGKKYTWTELAGMIKAVASEESRYFDVQVTSPDPYEAKVVCDYVVEAFCKVLVEKDMMNGAEGMVIHNPEVPRSPSSPNRTLTVILGALAGLVLSFGAILVVHFSKDSLEGEDWLIDAYKDKIPMLAVIPDANTAGKSYRKYYAKHRYGYTPKA